MFSDSAHATARTGWLRGLLMVLVGAAGGEPVTLYKPAQIAIARANIERYPWAQARLAAYRSQVAFFMDKDRAFIDAFIPDQTPWPSYGQSCPACVGKQSSMGETGVYTWSAAEPDQLICRYCKTVYPNPDYPETGVLAAPRMGQTFTYWLTPDERAHPEDTSGRYAYRWASWPVHVSWSGLIRLQKASFASSRILPLAQLYALTGDPTYATRCAWLLDRLATVYPNYLYHSYNGTYADCPPGEAAAEMGRNRPAGKFEPDVIRSAFPHLVDQNKDGYGELNNGFWGAGRLHSGVSEEGLLLLQCTVAYDLIRDAVGEDGQPLLTPEMRGRIENDLLLAGCADLENYPDINNKCGPGRALSAAVGMLFGQPDRVRRGLEGFERLLEGAFHFDGFCVESPSYSGMHLSLMREIPELLAGYSDPPGYQPAAGPRYDDFDPFESLPRYRLALESMVRMLTPNRRYPVIGDTHYQGGLSAEYAEILCAHYGERYAGLLELAQGKPLAEAGSEYALWHRRPDLTASADAALPLRSEWFPGWRVGVLRVGGPDSPTALYLNGYSMHGHRHDDTLGLIYYDHGRELASDRGYIWDDPRNAWTRSTLAHNLVTVDGAGQIGRDRHSSLEICDIGPGVEVLSASANAYAQCRTYRRTVALVRVDPDHTYALDVFAVAGGRLHQYGFQCNGRLAGVEGLAPEPNQREHRWLTNFRVAAPAPGGWRATWEDDGVRTALLVLSDADRLAVADAPGWRTYKGTELNAPPIHQVFAEREGEDLESTFVAVIAPYADAPAVRSAALVPADPGVVAVRVELPERTDWLILSPDDEPHRVGPFTIAGRFAYIALDAAGAVSRARLVEGTGLAGPGLDLTAEAPRVERRVLAVEGQTMRLAEPLPTGYGRPGSYVLAAGTGWEIAAVDGPAVTVRDYPLVECERATFPAILAWER